MHRRVQLAAATVITVIVGAVFYYAFIAPGLKTSKAPEAPAHLFDTPVARHPLTGVIVSSTPDFFPVSVMFDNFETVKTRPGLENASIVYEALAEGGITRLMGVFDSSDSVKKFGPIRSVRPYFIDWASEYGGILMHVGGSPEALDQLKNSDAVMDIDQIGAKEMYFTRDPSIQPPHNVFSSFSSWLQLDDRLHVPHPTITPWKYSDMAPQTQTATQQVDIIYSPGLKTSWAYNAEKNSYIRFVNGDAQLYATGDSVSASNVVIIQVPTETIDTVGRQHMKTLGSGPAQILRNGQTMHGTWMKETRGSRMRFIGDDQQEISLTPGRTWVAVVPSLDLVSNTQDATH